MPQDDNLSEIESIRKQLDALKKQRQDELAHATDENNAAAAESTDTGYVQLASEKIADLVGDENIEKLSGQLRDALESFDEDVRQVKPSTLLIVFALGVLLGRMR